MQYNSLKNTTVQEAISPKRTSQVESELGFQSNHLDELAKVCAQLEERLHTVVQPITQNEKEAPCDVPALVPIADSIRTNNTVIQRCVMNLKSLLSRIEC